ncbi:MAG: hypothetical protein KDJ86_09045 [Bauldia sp.]|uniref:hypothetical protein n=1 Tax=Bauldia sp. TaxID=2575872 RepID=UPI001D505C61|nr:hypothetical protein [Bauldia sp.]MCB1495917.1 hypothetical protein [Bauldia sp.]
MIVRTLMAAACLLLFSGLVSAQDIGGRYRVEGTNFDGSRYTGIAVIKVTSKSTCNIAWDTGSTAKGICMRNGTSFAASYVMGKAIGLVIYRINTDGSLEGLWTVAGEDGVGTETLIPQ